MQDRFFKAGFIDVEGENKDVTLEGDKINRVKYYPPLKRAVGPVYENTETIIDADGKEVLYGVNQDGIRVRLNSEKREIKTYPEKWVGYTNETKKNLG